MPEGPVDCGERGVFQVYKPAYVKHPIVLWAAGCRKHAEWVYFHAKALCREYSLRFNGKKHLSEYHVDHWKSYIDLHGWPLAMSEQITVDEWLQMFDEQKHGQLKWRVATENAPEGCLFGVLAFDMIGPRRYSYNDWTSSFEEYYIYKQYYSFHRPMRWSERNSKSNLYAQTKPTANSRKRAFSIDRTTELRGVSFDQ